MPAFKDQAPHFLTRSICLCLYLYIWASAFYPHTAQAWDRHALLTAWILPKEHSLTRKFENHLASSKNNQVDLNDLSEIAQSLQLNADQMPSSAQINKPQSARELIAFAVEAPDQGMDQDLPESADPHQMRKFMGGSTGPTSQGFRHMYFGGWEVSRPVSTFQVPTHALGEAPLRVEKTAQLARTKLKEASPRLALELIGWASHYVQDLTQPFHSTQIPNLGMVPFSALLMWPPSKGFANLVKETTRTISNYHWAYEGYVSLLLAQAEQSPFHSCMQQAPAIPFRWLPASTSAPRDLAFEVLNRSSQRASEMGSALMDFVGTKLKAPKYDLAHNQGALDYLQLSTDPSLTSARERLEKVTCAGLQDSVSASRLLYEWLLIPSP